MKLSTVLLVFTYLSLNQVFADDQVPQPSSGQQFHFFASDTAIAEDVERYFIEDQHEILHTAIENQRCQPVTHIPFDSARKYLSSEDVEEVLQSTSEKYNSDLNLISSQIKEFHLNHEQSMQLLELTSEYKDSPTASVLIFFFTSDVTLTTEAHTQPQQEFIYYDLTQALLFFERKNTAPRLDPSLQ